MKVTLIYFCFAEWDHQHSNNLCCFGKNVNNEKKKSGFFHQKRKDPVLLISTIYIKYTRYFWFLVFG